MQKNPSKMQFTFTIYIYMEKDDRKSLTILTKNKDG